MPSKFPKVFQKRKSSGDVLEDVRPVSSFRVLERPSETSKSLEEKPATGLRKPNIEFRPVSEGAIEESSARTGIQNRGSGGTQRSGSSYGAYNTSSSDRYSSSSTLPSAASIEGDDFHPNAHPRSSKTMPANADSGTGFLKTAGRKFSFGGKKSLQAAEALRANETLHAERPLYSGIHDLHIGSDLPAVPPIGRARATTETSHGSETTVTPAKTTLSKLDLNNNDDDDGFGDIFAGIGEEKRKSQMLGNSSNPSRQLTDKSNAYKPYRPESAMPAPLAATRPYESAPQLDSATSADGLMVASPVEEKNGVFEMGITSPIETRMAPNVGPQSPTSPSSPSRQNRPRRQSRQGSKSLLPRRDSDFYQDTDALLVSESASRKATPQVERAPPSYRDEVPALRAEPLAKSAEPASNPWAEEKPPPPPAHRQVPQQLVTPASPHDADVDQALLNDESFQALAISADRLQQRAPSPPRVKPAGKVMTPAQFERYRREQAQRRLADDDLSDSDDSKSENEEEEEDDYERNKRLAKQRQRQEAQMSVFRQSMMKTTGEQPIGPGGLKPPGSMNGSRLSTKTSLSNFRQPSSPSVEEDEDEDVPLGILAAHGFPSKEHNRPPNHERSGSAAGIQYSSETYPPPPQSVAAGPAGPLPAFARKLPQDPFYGASLVNQPDRQSFALGGGDRGSVYGGSQIGGSQSSTHLPPPGGLVGVIASEERARAIRRGTPAKNFGYGAQDPNGSMPLPPGVGGQPMMPMAPPPMMQPPQQSVEQQANVQMAQQMTQMMQMQMQWMQQMMSMQAQGMQMTPQMQQMQQMQQQMMMGMNPGMQGGMSNMSGMQMPNQHNGNGRSSTMMGSPNMHPNLGVPNQQGRAMSMMGGARAPSVLMGGMGPQPGYTPSIAPSERTNIGQPSRYRPVSTMPVDPDNRSRAQSFSSKSNFGGFGMSNGRTSTMGTRPTTSGGIHEPSQSRVNIRLVETRGDDEDDDAGWEEMRKKKENKKSLWRLRKGTGGSRDKENASAKLAQQPNEQAQNSNRSPEGLEGVFVPNIDNM